MNLMNGLIYLPILFGVLKIFARHKICRLLLNEVIFMLIMAVILFKITAGFDLNSGKQQFIYHYAWLKDIIGVSYSLSIDGLSLSMLLLSWVVILVVAFKLKTKSKNTEQSSMSALFFIMYGLINGSFLASNAILFFLFFEATIIPLFIIIGIWGGDDRIYATIKFMLYTLIGSLFLLIGFLYLGKLVTSQFGANSDQFAIANFYALNIPFATQKWLFWFLMLSFMVKIPMFPLHTWLPNAHVEAPTLGSVVLAAITLKIGGYGILKFVLPVTPLAANHFAPYIIVLSLIAIVYVAVLAMAQVNIKKIIAYSSISHMGFVTLGMFLIFILKNNVDKVTSLQGCIVVMVSHGFVSAAMFLMVGELIERFNTKYVKNMYGVVNSMPMFSVLSLFFILANCGLPGTSSFVGEFMVILAAAMSKHWLILGFALTSVLFGAAYSLVLYKNVFWRSQASIDETVHDNHGVQTNIPFKLNDITKTEAIPYLILVAMILLIGIHPNILLKLTEATTNALLTNIFR